ncbi:MAG: nitrate/nitrite transporter NrtS [Dongiaceae bacterium]
MSRWPEILSLCLSDGIPKRSLGVALIVGTILNLINQGDALFGVAEFNVTKMMLTYAVPYCVATYGAVSYRIGAARAAGERPGASPPDR